MRSRSEWLQSFDHLIFSSEVRLIKPDPAIFLNRLQVLRVKPEQALFIDDRDANVRQPSRWGLRNQIRICPSTGHKSKGLAIPSITPVTLTGWRDIVECLRFWSAEQDGCFGNHTCVTSPNFCTSFTEGVSITHSVVGNEKTDSARFVAHSENASAGTRPFSGLGIKSSSQCECVAREHLLGRQAHHQIHPS